MTGPRTSLVHDEVVRGLYAQFLNRAPGDQELNYWTNFLAENSFEALLQKVLASTEYQNKQGVQAGHPLGHFYSPVVDPQEIDLGRWREDLSEDELALLNISIDDMRAFWATHRDAILSADFADTARPDRRYYTQNPVFNRTDAMILRAMLLVHRPRRVIEIGSGFSSAVILDTAQYDALPIEEITFIEPHPGRLNALLRDVDRDSVRLIRDKVQNVETGTFDVLDANDILFIDSSHVLKTQSDVCFEFFDIIPRLKKGVVIHFHDIFHGFEYPRDWVLQRRYSWNEAYALRLFLSYNRDFRVLFFNSLFARTCKDLLERDCPRLLQTPGGSFWMQRA